eukprot:gene20917-22971_t
MAINEEVKQFILQSLNAVESRLNNTIGEIEQTVKIEIDNTLRSRLASIEEKWEEIEHSQQFHANQYETFRNQVGNLLRENTQLKNENVSLAARIKNLEKKDDDLAKSIDDLEQHG